MARPFFFWLGVMDSLPSFPFCFQTLETSGRIFQSLEMWGLGGNHD